MAAAVRTLEDPLSYLPCSTTVERRAGEVVFASQEPATRLYVIIQGYVKVSREVGNGREVLVDIYKTDEFFGESALTRLPRRPEKATALTNAAIMSWEIDEVEALMMKRPMLGVALAQLLAARDSGFVERIESLTTDNAGLRLARALLRFGERLGEREDEATVWMHPLTHALFAETVGTSREVVTNHMTALRRRGFVKYSRRGIILRDVALREWVRTQGARTVEEPAPEPILA